MAAETAMTGPNDCASARATVKIDDSCPSGCPAGVVGIGTLATGGWGDKALTALTADELSIMSPRSVWLVSTKLTLNISARRAEM
jgi:hypothetical protein